MTKIVLISFYLLLIVIGSCSKEEHKVVPQMENKISEKEVKKESKPFHNLQRGKKNPGDKDYHKGTYLESTVGLSGKENKDLRHPKNTEEMITFYSARIISHPNDINSWIMLGAAYYIKKNYTKAIFYFDKAIGIDPKNIDAHINKAFVLLDQDKIEKAIEYFKKVISIDKDYPNSYFGLAQAYERSMSSKDAIKAWEYYLTIAKKNEKINKKWILRAQKNLKRLKSFNN